MTLPTYQLLDGEELNRKHPRTFHIPNTVDKNQVEPGDHVKLGFSCPNYPNNERMWVKVTGEGLGYLDNDPAFLPLTWKMKVRFEHKHILDILKNNTL
jgi:hypothetical protein